MDIEGTEKEALIQELHSVKIKMTQLQKMYEDSLVIENEYNTLETKFKDLENDLYQAVSSKKKVEEENKTLKELLEKELTECQTLREELENARKEPHAVPTPFSPCNCHLTISALQAKMEYLEKELESLKFEKREMNKLHAELQNNYQSTASQLEEMTTMYEAKRDELQSSKQIVEGLTEDKVLLEAELHQLKVPNVNLNEQGNSLFAEVEDKRKSTAKNLEVMKLKFNKLNQKYNQAQQELRKLKDENIQLLNEASNDKVRQIEAQMMESYRTRIADLEKAVAIYSKRPESPIIKTVDFPDLPMVSAMVDRARNEAESLRIELLRKSHSESQQATKVYMAQRKLRLSEAAIQAKEKEIEKMTTKLQELEETEKLYLKLKEDLESESKENDNPQNGGLGKKLNAPTKFVRFCSDFKSQIEEEINKPKIVKQPKCISTPLIFVKSGGPVIEVSTELKNYKDSLKKAE